MRIFVTPDIVPSTSSTRHFYNVDSKRNKINRGAYMSWPLYHENDYWYRRLEEAVVAQIDETIEIEDFNHVQTCIHISNYIFRRVIENIDNGDVNYYTAFRYLWNRLACHSDRLDLVIDRCLFRKKANFRPTITKSKLYDKEAKTLIVNSVFLNFTNSRVFMRMIQMLFCYLSDPENRYEYGRLLKSKVTRNDFGKHDIKYQAGSLLYDPEKHEDYVVPKINSFDRIVRSNCSPKTVQISRKEKETIENLDPIQLSLLYNYLVELVHKG